MLRISVVGSYLDDGVVLLREHLVAADDLADCPRSVPADVVVVEELDDVHSIYQYESSDAIKGMKGLDSTDTV